MHRSFSDSKFPGVYLSCATPQYKLQLSHVSEIYVLHSYSVSVTRLKTTDQVFVKFSELAIADKDTVSRRPHSALDHSHDPLVCTAGQVKCSA